MSTRLSRKHSSHAPHDFGSGEWVSVLGDGVPVHSVAHQRDVERKRESIPYSFIQPGVWK